MRKFSAFMWAMAALLLAAVSCNEKGEDPYLKAEHTGTSVSVNGGTATFTIESNVDWTVSNSDPWITAIEPKTGQGNGEVTVTFATNADAQERSSVFTVTSEAATASVTITQTAAEESLTVEYTGTNVSVNGGTATFTIESNVDWTVSNSDPWITAIEPKTGQGNGSVTVTFAANAEVQERSSVFKVTSEAATASVTITQTAAEESLTVEYTPADVPATGGTVSFTIRSSTSWTITVQDGATWLTPSPASGSGDATVTVTVAPNEGVAREGTLHVATAGSFVKPVVINQKELTIDDLVGTWTVTSTYVDHSGRFVGDHTADHTATVTKIDENTIRIDDFLGIASLLERDDVLDSQTFTFDPSNRTLTIIDPNTTEITWDDNKFCFIAVDQKDVLAENAGIPFPVYTVANTGGVLSIDFRDPKSVYGGVSLCNILGSDRATGEIGGSFGFFFNVDFTKD